MSTLLNASASEKKQLPHTVAFVSGGAPPPEAVLAAMKAAGFHVGHVYGLTETYGPAAFNEWNDDWDKLTAAEQAERKARQGVATTVLHDLDVLDPATMLPIPRDGKSMGEVMFRGNVVMRGYLKNRAATEECFAGGWFHSGDLGVDPSGRLYPAQGPLQGHHHFRRREYLLDRNRGGALSAPRRWGRRRGRQARREMG